MESRLVEEVVGTVWALTIDEEYPNSSLNVIQVATNRSGEDVRRILFRAWKSGYLVGNWCRVMLHHKDKLSVSVAGGTVDPLIAHAGDSIVDGNRWLTVTEKALADCVR
jgi:hypothetical protein